MSLDEICLSVVGLGYVGLPLAVEFGKRRTVIGFDVSQVRIEALSKGVDNTLKVSGDELEEASQLIFTADMLELAKANVFIVTVPAPIDKFKQPDLSPLIKASQMLGRVLKKGDIVIYESTVYPGATEDVCVPELESASGLVFNQDFYVGYSPERITRVTKPIASVPLRR